ncbi:MAG: DUF3617 domain-containing protein [Sphingomonas sp.]
MRFTLVACLPFALAACHQQSTADSAAKTGEVSLNNASVAEVAKQANAAGPAHFSPGEWQTEIEIAEIDMPGVPPQVRDQMAAKMKATKTSVKTCLTKEQADKPQSEMFAGKNNDCTFDHYTMAGGRLDAKMTCKAAQGGSMTQTIAGTFTDTSYALTSEMNAAGPQPMHMKAKVNGTRIGACKG